MKAKKKKAGDELRSEYNFDYSKAFRGKYFKQIKEEGANVVKLDPDVAKVFVDSESVNNALRSLLLLMRKTRKLKKHQRTANIQS